MGAITNSWNLNSWKTNTWKANSWQDKLLKGILLTRETPDKKNSWKYKLMKYKQKFSLTLNQILVNVSQLIFNLVVSCKWSNSNLNIFYSNYAKVSFRALRLTASLKIILAWIVINSDSCLLCLPVRVIITWF